MVSPSIHATRAPTPQPIHSILLVVRTRTGPRLALYYPPTFPIDHPYFNGAHSNRDSELTSDSENPGGSDSGSNSWSDNEEEIFEDPATARPRPALHQRRRVTEPTPQAKSSQEVDTEKKAANSHSLRHRSRTNRTDGSGRTIIDIGTTSTSTLGEVHRNDHEGSVNNLTQSTLASLPPYNLPEYGLNDDHVTTGSGAGGGAGASISRTSSFTKFKLKQGSEHDRDTKNIASIGGNVDQTPPEDAKTQYASNSTTQYDSAQSKTLHQVDSSERNTVSGLHSVLEKSESLAKLLAPSDRSWHKRRFEIGVDNVTFLGCPIFERRSGGWRSRAVGGRKKTEHPRDADKEEAARSEQTEHDFDIQESKSGESTADEEDAEESKESSPTKAEGFRDASNQIVSTQTESSRGNAIEPSVASLYSKQTPQLPTAGNSLTSTASLGSTPGNGDGASVAGSGSAPESLTMFHLVFAIIPPSNAPGEHQACIQTLYKNVVSPMTKALAYTQKKKNFVWTEMRLVANVCANANVHLKTGNTGTSADSMPPYAQMWESIVKKSELAQAIETAYENITAGTVAHLAFGSGITQSLQIPQPVSTVQVVTPMSPQHRGLRPSTFKVTENLSRKSSRDNGRDSNLINPYASLLLLQDADDLVNQELPRAGIGTKDLLIPLTFLVRHSLSTKTLIQMSKRLGMSQKQVQMLSMHLIKYRLAIAIPPLHPSNTYITSPNANFKALPEAAKEFGRQFAMLPGLVTILGRLSSPRNAAGPQPWITLIPSSDHKAAYMEILEWLVRGGWVVQLRTFCWVRVSREVKADVARILRQEEEERVAAEAAEEAAMTLSEEELDSDHVADEKSARRKSSGSGRASGSHFGDVVAAAPGASILSPRLKAHLSPPGPAGPPSDAGSASTARTAVRISNLSLASARTPTVVVSRNTSGTRENRPSDGDSEPKTSLDEGRYLKEEKPEIRASDFEPSIIACPQKANAIESRWLKHVALTLPQEELRTIWPRLVKYFDGKQAIEEIAMYEGLKRKVITPMLAKLIRDNDVLLTVRHW